MNKPLRTRSAPMAEALEFYLRGLGVPYIVVNEAKRALFAGAKLKSFHFVIYRPSECNLLVWAAKSFTKADREDCLQWQSIFGAGFKLVRAFAKGDGFAFKALDGAEVLIPSARKET
jgi:hypothetical protein